MTTQPLAPSTIFGNISLSDSSETDITSPSPRPSVPTLGMMTSRETSSSSGLGQPDIPPLSIPPAPG